MRIKKSFLHYSILHIFLLFIVLTGCSSIRATPWGPSNYAAPCDSPPLFRINLEKISGFGSYAWVHAYLMVNGREISMLRPDGSMWGYYVYNGDVPYDGEIRFRYRIETRRSGFSSVGSFYRPFDAYYVSNMGHVSWTGSNVDTLENDWVSVPISDRPRRTLKLTKTINPASFTGIMEVTETLTVQNSLPHTISISQPQVLDIASGNAVPEFTLVPVSGAASYPIAIPAGRTIDFLATYTENITAPTGFSINKDAGIQFDWSAGSTVCPFGPIWISGTFRAMAG